MFSLVSVILMSDTRLSCRDATNHADRLLVHFEGRLAQPFRSSVLVPEIHDFIVRRRFEQRTEGIEQEKTDNHSERKDAHRMMPLHLSDSPEQQQDAGKNDENIIQITLTERHYSLAEPAHLDT